MTNSPPGLIVVSSRRPVPTPGSELFPPLFAVPYQGPADVARDYPSGDSRSMTFLNANHPLCRWLFANASVLSEDFAAPFKRVFRAGPSAWDSPETVNKALDLVARARPAIAPPPDAYLKIAPNGQWVSR